MSGYNAFPYGGNSGELPLRGGGEGVFEFIISNLRVTIMLNLFVLFGGEVA